MAAKKMAKKATKKKGRTLLVQCYGLFWRVADVLWGEPGVRGRLLGKPAKKKKAEPIDFREQTGIYVLYDNFKVLYVGQAGYGNAKLFNRLKAHFTDSLADRWNRFSWFGLRWVKADGDLSGETKAKHPPIGDVLNHMEAILIASTEPALNRQGGRWGKAVQYLQDEDTELEPRTEEMIRQLYERMEEQKEAEEKAKKKAKKKKP